jgi:hypothetical protein
MARRYRDANGKIVKIELTLPEMAKSLGVDADQLEQWTDAIPPAGREGDQPYYAFTSVKELNTLKKRAKVLATGMTEKALANIEAEGLLDAYAALAEDCPKGITVHVWRSYGLVVLMQIRYGKMIDPTELAERAGLAKIDPKTGEAVPDVELAEKHLRLLQALGYLQIGEGDEWGGQWKHQGLPAAWANLA